MLWDEGYLVGLAVTSDVSVGLEVSPPSADAAPKFWTPPGSTVGSAVGESILAGLGLIVGAATGASVGPAAAAVGEIEPASGSLSPPIPITLASNVTKVGLRVGSDVDGTCGAAAGSTEDADPRRLLGADVGDDA